MPSILKDGVVIVTCDHLPDEDDLAERGETAIEETGEVGQEWDGAEFSNPPQVAIDVREITKRQLFLQLEEDGNLGQWDALMASLGLPENARDKTLWETSTGLTITDQQVVVFAQAFGYSGQTLQDLWNRAGTK